MLQPGLCRFHHRGQGATFFTRKEDPGVSALFPPRFEERLTVCVCASSDFCGSITSGRLEEQVERMLAVRTVHSNLNNPTCFASLTCDFVPLREAGQGGRGRGACLSPETPAFDRGAYAASTPRSRSSSSSRAPLRTATGSSDSSRLAPCWAL